MEFNKTPYLTTEKYLLLSSVDCSDQNMNVFCSDDQHMPMVGCIDDDDDYNDNLCSDDDLLRMMTASILN